ncbi:MAG: CDP-diacylglycerol--serine O-phosphatidyltransferase [Rubricoccaceae bacterium]
MNAGRTGAGAAAAPRRGRMIARRRRRLHRIPPVAVPSAFTLGNLLSGYFSVVQASLGNLEVAAWLIVLAALFDVFDGMVARWAGADSAFGLQLDSLADVVSFGAAPSFLLFSIGLRDFPAGAFISALPAIAGAVRLARFNTLADDGIKKDHFVGLPIPAAAGTIVAFILTFQDDTWFAGLDGGRLPILLTVVVAVSLLMVSPVRFPALPQPNRHNLRAYPRRFLFFALGLVLTLTLREVGLLVMAAAYLSYGLGAAVVWAFRVATYEPRRSGEPPGEPAVPRPNSPPDSSHPPS